MKKLSKEQIEKMKKEDREAAQKSREFQPLDLNEDTVLTIYRRLTDPATYINGEPAIIVPLYYRIGRVEYHKENGDIIVPKKNINRDLGKIKYLFGQLDEMHHLTEPYFIDIPKLVKKYDGTNWTQKNSSVLALIYLGIASNTITPISQKHNLVHVLTKPLPSPTLSPNDPNFEKWYEGTFKKTHDKDGLELPK